MKTRKYLRWTDEELLAVSHRVEAGETYPEIAESLGTRAGLLSAAMLKRGFKYAMLRSPQPVQRPTLEELARMINSDTGIPFEDTTPTEAPGLIEFANFLHTQVVGLKESVAALETERDRYKADALLLVRENATVKEQLERLRTAKLSEETSQTYKDWRTTGGR